MTNKVVVTFDLNAVLSAMDLSKDEMLLEVNLKAVAVLHTKRTLQLGLSDIVARVRGDGLCDVAITNALKVTVLLIHSDSIDALTIKVTSLKDEAIDLSLCNLPIQTTAIILSGIISFGGISINLQALTFLKKMKINLKFYFLQKFTHTLLSMILAYIFGLIIL